MDDTDFPVSKGVKFTVVNKELLGEIISQYWHEEEMSHEEWDPTNTPVEFIVCKYMNSYDWYRVYTKHQNLEYSALLVEENVLHEIVLSDAVDESGQSKGLVRELRDKELNGDL